MVTTISSSILIFSILLLASFNGAHGRLSTRNPRRQTYADDEDFFSMPMESVEEEEDNVSPLEQRDVCIVGGGPSVSIFMPLQSKSSLSMFNDLTHLPYIYVTFVHTRDHTRHIYYNKKDSVQFYSTRQIILEVKQFQLAPSVHIPVMCLPMT